MKSKLFILMAIILSMVSHAQNLRNNNWVFGKNQWDFNLESTGSITRTNVTFTGIDKFRYQSSSISHPTTGEFMFVTDGFNVYNKNLSLMDNGENLFNIPDTPSGSRLYTIKRYGNKTGQGSLILPHPGNTNLYYIFSLSIAYKYNDDFYSPAGIVDVPGYGLSYSIVDMSQNGGLGKVISRNNSLINASHGTQGMTSTIASDGNSYWFITYRGNQFLSYKIGTSGLNTTPIVSTTPYTHTVGEFLRISPDGKYIFTRYKGWDSKVMLYEFNSINGNISGATNVLDAVGVTNPSGYYQDSSIVRLNSAEFSPDSKIIYFIASEGCLCLEGHPYIHQAGLIAYNIQTNQIIGFLDGKYTMPIGASASLQMGEDKKIYLIHFGSMQNDDNYYHTTIDGWNVINNPNVWGNTSPFSAINNNPILHGMSFPQLIPSPPPCPVNLNITTPITSSRDFQVSNKIEASSTISQNINVNFKASRVVLNPGFNVSGFDTGVFTAVVNPCSGFAIIKDSKQEVRKDFIEEQLIYAEPNFFPNPTTTILNIDNIEDIIEWKLVDLNGKTVESGKVNNSIQTKITINTSRLLSGVYYFNAVMKSGELFQKTVMKK